MSVSKRNRFETFKRDKFTCQYCGRAAPDVILHVDHIQPKSKGGSDDDLLNLVTSCKDCNLGKGARVLSDDTAVKKRKKQLDEIQERREQLEMLMEWHRSLLQVDEDLISGLADYWSDLVPGYTLNENGLQNLRKWLNEYGFEELIQAIQIAASQYVKYEVSSETPYPLKESVELAFSKISGICITRKRMEKKPYLKDLYYIRGILRNRNLSYFDPNKALWFMENAVKAGASPEDIKGIALTANNWSDFRQRLEALYTEDENQNPTEPIDQEPDILDILSKFSKAKGKK